MIWLPLLASNLSWAARLDASQLGKPAPAAKPQAQSTMSGKRVRGAPPRLSLDDESKLANSIASFGLIIDKTAPGPSRNKLILGRAKTRLALAQLRLMKSKSLTSDPTGQALILGAKQDAGHVAIAPDSSFAARAEALFLKGLAADYLGAEAEATESFAQALRLDPKARDAGWMAFYLAESHFEAKRFQEALAHYKGHYSQWDDRLKRIAAYKIAWTYVNLDQIDAGQKYFTLLSRGSKPDDIAQDALRDLAFIMTKFRSESEILDAAEKTFSDPKRRLEFLSKVCDQQELQGLAMGQSKVFAHLVEREKDPVARIKLKIRNLSSLSREFASLAHYKAFDEVRALIEREGFAPGASELAPILDALDLETQRLIRPLTDAFAGKTQSPDRMSHADIGAKLTELLRFHAAYFRNSATRPAIHSLWLDACLDLKDWKCVNEVSKAIAQDPALASIHDRAMMERLGALEELNRADAGAYGPELLEAAARFLRDRPKSDQWVRVARRLAELKQRSGDVKDAISVLSEVYARDPNTDHFYRLQWARFNDGRFKELLDDRRDASLGEKPDPKLVDLRRESALRLALEARKDGDLDEYSERIDAFISHSSDPAKTRLARKDYFSFLIEKGESGKAAQALLALPPAERCSADLAPLSKDIALHLLKSGSFKEVLSITGGADCNDPDLLYDRLLAQLSVEPAAIDVSALSRLSQPRREHLLGLLALVDPSAFERALLAKPPASDSERSLALIGMRMKKEAWSFAPTPREKAWLGGLGTGMEADRSLTRAEEKLKRLSFPSVPKRRSPAQDRRFAKELKFLADLTPELRKKVEASLVGRAPEVQARVLAAARDFEKRLADLIVASPVPEGLDGSQALEYRRGLEEVAQTYLDRMREYEKLLELALAKSSQASKASEERTLPEPKAWGWPSLLSSGDGAALRRTYEQAAFAGLLVMADLHRDGLLKDAADYHRLRSGALLNLRSSAVLRRYVYEELAANGQSKLIEEWKERLK